MPSNHPWSCECAQSRLFQKGSQELLCPREGSRHHVRITRILCLSTKSFHQLSERGVISRDRSVPRWLLGGSIVPLPQMADIWRGSAQPESGSHKPKLSSVLDFRPLLLRCKSSSSAVACARIRSVLNVDGNPAAARRCDDAGCFISSTTHL